MTETTLLSTVLAALVWVPQLLSAVVSTSALGLSSWTNALVGHQSGASRVVGDIVELLPPPDTILGAVVYGGGSVLGLGGGRKLVRRVRSNPGAVASAATTAANTSVSSTTGGGTPASIKHDEAAFTLPAAVPLSKGVRNVTHNEIHALELGVVVGFATVWLFSIGRQNAAGGIVLAFVAGGLGLKRYRSKALATTRMEPWYAFVSFALGAIGGWVFFFGPLAAG